MFDEVTEHNRRSHMKLMMTKGMSNPIVQTIAAVGLAALAAIRPGLPVLIASGVDDPLAGGGQLVELLGQRYRDAGLTDVTVRLYEGARHEIFNETNRGEVTDDVIAWLDAHR